MKPPIRVRRRWHPDDTDLERRYTALGMPLLPWTYWCELPATPSWREDDATQDAALAAGLAHLTAHTEVPR